MAKEEKDANPSTDYIIEALKKLKLPKKQKEDLLNKIEELRKYTVDAREPRIAFVGRRGSGKSSLINALFNTEKQYVSSVKAGTGEGKWFWYPSENEKKVRLLDSRGLGESEKPTEDYKEVDPIEELKRNIDKETPDVFLFLIKAKETDARIEADLNELKNLIDYIEKTYNYKVPVLCVVTQVDELDPPHYKSLPLDGNPKKAKNIGEAVDLMNKRFREKNIDLIKTIPVSAYLDFDEDGNIEYDLRWNVEELGEYLIDVLPDEAKLKTARASKAMKVKKNLSNKIIALFSSITGLVGGVNNIPVADIFPITALQGLMVMTIAYISGKEISLKSSTEFIVSLGVNTGVAFVAREGARAVVKFAPGIGNLASAGISIAVTTGIGYAAVAYYIQEKDIDAAKKAFKEGKKKSLMSNE